MELNEYKQKLLLILIISKFKISCPCLLTLISRICIILTHPWGAPECPKGVFHAFLADATGTASSWPNLLARPHSSVTRSEAVLCDPLLDSGLAAQFPVLLCRRSAWGSLAWKVPQPGSGDSLGLRVWPPRWSLTLGSWDQARKAQEEQQQCSSESEGKEAVSDACWSHLRTLKTLRPSKHFSENKTFNCWQHTAQIIWCCSNSTHSFLGKTAKAVLENTSSFGPVLLSLSLNAGALVIWRTNLVSFLSVPVFPILKCRSSLEAVVSNRVIRVVSSVLK